jgi:pilus assembly protein CpaE
MSTDTLNVSVLFGTGVAYPRLSMMLETLDVVQVTSDATDPMDFLADQKAMEADAVIVCLDGEPTPPSWLAKLTQTRPQTMVLLCAESREQEYVIRAMQLGVREFLPLPLARSDLEGALERVRVAKKTTPGKSAKPGKMVVVMGNKGGVGTTTVAINLAEAMGDLLSERIALVDLGRPFPDIANFLDQEVLFNICNIMGNNTDFDQTYFQKVMQPYGKHLSILHGIPDFKQQYSMSLDGLDRTFSLLRNSYRWIVVDLGHMIDEVYLKVFSEADLVLLLTGVSVADLRNSRKLLLLLREVDPSLERINFVVNRYEKECSLGLAELEKLIHKPVFSTLPTDHHFAHEASNQAETLAKAAPKCKLFAGLNMMAQKLAKQDQVNNAAKNENRKTRRFWLF